MESRQGTTHPEMAKIANISREGRQSNSDSDLAVTAGWGHTQARRESPCQARARSIKRAYTEEELSAITEGADALGLTTEQASKNTSANPPATSTSTTSPTGKTSPPKSGTTASAATRSSTSG